MPESTTQERVDHVEIATKLLKSAADPNYEAAVEPPRDHYLAAAQVNASLAIEAQLQGIREALGDYLGDGSNADQIAQALRAIAEPDKYGIDPRSLR